MSEEKRSTSTLIQINQNQAPDTESIAKKIHDIKSALTAYNLKIQLVQRFIKGHSPEDAVRGIEPIIEKANVDLDSVVDRLNSLQEEICGSRHKLTDR